MRAAMMRTNQTQRMTGWRATLATCMLAGLMALMSVGTGAAENERDKDKDKEQDKDKAKVTLIAPVNGTLYTAPAEITLTARLAKDKPSPKTRVDFVLALQRKFLQQLLGAQATNQELLVPVRGPCY